MKRIVATLVMSAFLVATLAGCIGDGFGSGAPRAVVKVDQVAKDTYVFDGSPSSGKGLSYEWDFGDGTEASDARVEHTFEYGDATYSVRLVIEDSEGTKDVWEDDIVVGSGENSPPEALFKPDARNFEENAPVRVDASESSDPEGAPLVYKWDFNYLMDFEEYSAFKSAKKGAGQEDDDFESGGGESNEPTAGLPQNGPGLKDTVEKLDPTGIFGKKHSGHDTNDKIERSIYSHEVETDEPVYVMEEGYPDTTTFFIKLVVTDIAGGFEEIVSEEIWAVEVYSEGKLPPKTARGNTSDTLDIGIHSQAEDVHSEIPDLDLYTYEAEWEFTLEWPVAPSQRQGTNYYPGGWINLTWESESDTAAQSILDMEVTAPSGKKMSGHKPENSNGVAYVQLDGNNDYIGDSEEGTPWRVYIIARSGADIDWELEYWAKMNTNKFTGLDEGEGDDGDDGDDGDE